MKLSVRKKIANGLVLFLLVPKAATSANELIDTYAEGISEFTADDEVAFQSHSLGSDSLVINSGGVGVATGDGKSGDGSDPTGGDPTGGDPTGGDPTGGDPTGGDPTGGDPTGGDPTGGDPTGGDPTGGDPTGGDPTGGDPTGGDPTGGDPTGYDPSGIDFDPPGDDPSACSPASTAPLLDVHAPIQLVTAENHSVDIFEMSMDPEPTAPRTFKLESTDPSEAIPVPGSVTFGSLSCVPQTIQVVGQNDYLIDGDVNYAIEVLDEQDFVVATVPGVNFDNDDYTGVVVDVVGSNAIPQGGSGVFQVRVANISGERIRRNILYVETTEDLQITNYAASLLSGEPYSGNIVLRNGELRARNVRLESDDMLILTVDITLDQASTTEQVVSARFVNRPSSEEVDDAEAVRTAVP